MRFRSRPARRGPDKEGIVRFGRQAGPRPWRRLLLAAGFTMAACGTAGAGREDLFGIYVSTLSGEDYRAVITDSRHQMTHPRVSPDGEWVTFTRYQKKNWAGLAMEKGGYENTEIMLVRLDGRDLRTIVPAKKGVLNCNSTWTSDGKSLVWLTTDNPKKSPELRRIELSTRKISRIPTPPDLKTTDPHVVGDRIVFPVIGEDVDSIWVMDLDGENLKRVTSPRYDGKEHEQRSKRSRFPLGDYDPKLSPDGKRVAFMRLFGAEGWRIFVADVATGEERDLSGPDSIDALPDWSSDGKLLLFWHADKKNPERMGLYTMKPDGRDRRMIPVPRGYLHGHPHFFPNSGSSSSARIIYQAIKAPKLP
jgi:Tol biopolymer transport system component